MQDYLSMLQLCCGRRQVWTESHYMRDIMYGRPGVDIQGHTARLSALILSDDLPQYPLWKGRVLRQIWINVGKRTDKLRSADLLVLGTKEPKKCFGTTEISAGTKFITLFWN